MMSHKKYNLFISIPLVIFLTIVVALGIRIQPHDGGLTRVGGFLEKDFGWNAPQKYFSTLQFTFAKGIKYTKYYDIVVLGDSFSRSFPHSQWQNYFVARTGLSLITYDLVGIDIHTFVTSPEFFAHPPRMVIYETVERSFVGRGNSWNNGNCQANETPKPDWFPLTTQSSNQIFEEHIRNTKTGLLHPNISTSVHYIKRLIKKTFNKKSNRALKYALTRNDLFSNRLNNFALFFRNDFNRYAVSKEQFAKAICGYYAMQNLFQKNGKTLFVGMVAPDKLTAYFDWIKDFDRDKTHWTTEIDKHPELNMIPLLKALRREIGNGGQDVYLPNDTHWGPNGMKVASDTLYQYLKDSGALKPDE